MNRNQRREQSKELKKNTSAINSLTPPQAKVLNLVAEEKALAISNMYILNFQKVLDRSMSAALIEYGMELKTIDEVQKSMSKLLIEDSEKSKKLEGENINMSNIEKDVQDAVEILLEEGKGKKQAIDILIYKFPTLSKSMLINAYAKIVLEHKPAGANYSKEEITEEFNIKSTRLSGKEMIDHAMEKYGFTKSTAQTYYYKWKKEFMGADKVVPAPEEETQKNIVVKENPKMIIETNGYGISKEVKEKAENIIKAVEGLQIGTPVVEKAEITETKGLKILNELIIKTIKVQGENGIYYADTNEGVTLDKTISFKNEKELNAWVEEFRKVFKLIA